MTRATTVRVLSVVGRIAALVLVLGPSQAALYAQAFRSSPVWDDGKAEFCAYEVDWRRYGELYPGRALLITVKEPWAPDLEVKADRPRADGFEVLKLNHIRDVPTGIYTYHQMASLFVRRDTGELRKLAVTSSEGCGISTARMLGGVLETRSYFDDQGERRQPYPQGAIPEDGLPISLRDYLDGPLPESIDVLPSLMTGRFPDLTPTSYRLSRKKVDDVETPAGVFATLELRLEAGDSWMAYQFSSESPHPLVRLERSDGTVYRLARCERTAYWQQSRPGGEEWLPESVR